MNRTVLKNDRWMFELVETADGALLLHVVCGGIAMYEATLPLDATEREQFEQEGEAFIVELARRVATSESAFAGRLSARK